LSIFVSASELYLQKIFTFTLKRMYKYKIELHETTNK